jgi:hypothetical protein
VLGAIDEVARDDAFVQDPPVVVDVLEEEIERRDALAKALLKLVPLGAQDDAGQKVRRNDLFRRFLVAVDGEGDALVQKGLLTRLLPANEFLGGKDCECFVEALGVRSRCTGTRRCS